MYGRSWKEVVELIQEKRRVVLQDEVWREARQAEIDAVKEAAREAKKEARKAK